MCCPSSGHSIHFLMTLTLTHDTDVYYVHVELLLYDNVNRVQDYFLGVGLLQKVNINTVHAEILLQRDLLLSMVAPQ